MFSSRPWHFMMLRSGLREVEIRVWQKQNATALDLSSLCRQWHRWPAHACSLQGWKMPLSQRRAAWSHRWLCPHTHTRTPCMCPRSHPCMHEHPHAHTHTAQCCMLHSTSKSGNVPASGWVRGIMLAHKLGLPFHPSVVERFKWNVRISFPNIVFQ